MRNLVTLLKITLAGLVLALVLGYALALVEYYKASASIHRQHLQGV